MKFVETDISGAYLIDLDIHADDRGFFARIWCAQEFKKMQLESHISQCNLSFNKQKGTLRGLHYQKPPFEEVKIVRCIRGAIFDVIVDLRKESASYRLYSSVELTAENRKALYVPKGCAHGFQTLTDDCEVLYFSSEFYHPECESCVRWSDPMFNITWPKKVSAISDKDSSAQDWQP